MLLDKRYALGHDKFECKKEEVHKTDQKKRPHLRARVWKQKPSLRLTVSSFGLQLINYIIKHSMEGRQDRDSQTSWKITLEFIFFVRASREINTLL